MLPPTSSQMSMRKAKCALVYMPCGPDRAARPYRLLDHLVGAREQRGRHLEAKRRGGFEINNQLELGWLHDWQVCWLRPFENSTGVDTSEAPSVREAGAVADQGA